MKTINKPLYNALLFTCAVFTLAACSSSPSPWATKQDPWESRHTAQPESTAPSADEYKQDLAVEPATSEIEMSYQTEPVESSLPMEADQAEPEPMESAAVMETPEPAAEMPSESITGVDDLMSQPANYYTVQVIASVDEDRVYKFAEQHQLSVRYIVPTVRDGVTWHVLLLDVYPDLASAKSALAEVQDTLPTSPWIRKLGSVQALIKQ